MKKTLRSVLALLLTLACILALASCFDKGKGKETDLWKSATHTKDTAIGEGALSFAVGVEADGKTVIFLVSTDKGTVGEALLDLGLIAGDAGAYGLYVKTVNGIRADYDLDGAYWAFYENGEYAMTGVDSTAINEGTVYRLVYTKG